jgi:hypothetical protein
MSKEPVSFRLSPEGRRLLNELSRRLGVSRTSILELLIRQKAKEEGIALGGKKPK